MIEFVFAPRAEDDLAAIWEYLAVESGVALADRIQQEVVDRCAALPKHPRQGHFRLALHPDPVRFVAVYQWLVAYRPTKPLEIIAVIHGHQDVRRHLRER